MNALSQQPSAILSLQAAGRVIDDFSKGNLDLPESALAGHIVAWVRRGRPLSSSVEEDVAWLLACYRGVCERQK